jgi:hypothetical protein
MSLIQSAHINGHDPYAYLKGVLTRLPLSEQVKLTGYCRISGRLPDLRKVCSPFAYGLQTGRLIGREPPGWAAMRRTAFGRRRRHLWSVLPARPGLNGQHMQQ